MSLAPARRAARQSRSRLPRRAIAAIVAGALVAAGLPFVAAGIATAATTENGMTLSLDDGQVVSGVVPVTASDTQGGGPASITIDGQAQPVTHAGPEVNLIFQAHGWEATTKNTFYVNGGYAAGGVEVEPMTRYYDWANGSWAIPFSALRPGENTIELRIASGTTVLDPAPNANDDFRVRNVKLQFPGGVALTDPAVGNNQSVDLGDSVATLNRTFTWTITVPATQLITTANHSWNTDGVAPGEHEVVATSADGARSASATVRIADADPTPDPEDPSPSPTPDPEDPGPEDPEEPSGLAFNVSDGSTISGIKTINVTDALSDEPLSIALDGEDQPVSPLASTVNIAFEAHGMDAAAKNTIVINDQWSIVPATSYSGYATGRFPVPAAALHAGVNKIVFYTGSAAMMNDPAADGRNDDFNVRNLRLEFTDGSRASDPRMSATALANIGDAAVNNRSWQWDISVPESQIASGSSFHWDTTGVDSGAHELSATSNDGSRTETIDVTVDNYEKPVFIDVVDGSVLSGVSPVSVATDVTPIVEVDGAPIELEKTQREIDPTFVFEANGFQPGSTMNSIWVNGEMLRVIGGHLANSFTDVPLTIPWERLRPGTNTIRIRSGSNLDPVATTGVDNFQTRNARMEFAGGRVVSDPAHSPTQLFSYSNNRLYNDFVITIPAGYEALHEGLIDTTTLSDGEHTLVARRPDGREPAELRVDVDNAGPAIDVRAPLEGASYRKSSFDVDVDTEDAHDVSSVDIAIDDVPVLDGQTVTADDLRDGEHTLTVTAKDSAGNISERSVNFSTVGNYPFAAMAPQPATGAADQPAHGTTLSAVVRDPSADALDVQVKWAFRGDFAEGANVATQGSSKTAVPAQSAGDATDDAGYRALSTVDGDALTTSGDGAYPFQQFEIAVPQELHAETFTVDWTGSVPATQRAALSVWNHRTGTWELVAEGTGEDLELSGNASVADSVREGKAKVMVQDVAATVIAEDDASAVMAWISDTQFYAESDEETYRKQMQWVLDNRESERLGYGVHTGDIINQTTVESQWDVADRMQKMWDDAGFPYGVVPGNHDVDMNADGTFEEKQQSYVTYSSYFGEHRYGDNPWYGGGFEDNAQHYDIVSTPGADYLFLYIDCYLEDDEVAWANEVIRAHPDYNVVIATHQYFDNDGNYIAPGPKIFEEIVKPNPNVDIVLSGHIGIALETKDLGGGRSVIEVMGDYQSAPTYGGGWMRTMTFDAAAQTFSNRTFSVTQAGNHWVDEAKENFTLPLTLDAPARTVSTDYVGITAKTDDVIAAASDVASGEQVEAPAGDLAPDTRYAWYVQSEDADGFATDSPVWTFTTGDAVDTVAPALSVPAATRVVAGSAFDPMAGVTAMDGVDGDLTSAVQVTGTVDVATPGEYRLTYTVADAAGNIGTVERVVTVVAEGEDWGPLEPGAETLVVQKLEGRELTVQVPTEQIGVPLTWVAYSEPTVIGDFASDETGMLTLTLPEGLEAGEHRIAGHAPDGSAVTWAPFEVPAAPTTGDQELEVDVPEVVDGEFVWSIDGSNGVVDLGTAEDRGDRYEAAGAINPIRVTDTRRFSPEWSLSAQVSDFTGDAGTFSGKFLGWAPKVVEPGGGAVAGAPVVSGFDSGNGLSEASGLGSAPTGHERGSAKLGADLSLKLPVEVGQGTYRATLTLTALS